MLPPGTAQASRYTRLTHRPDAIFPILPRWYTNPLRAHARGPSTIYPGAVQQPSSYPSSFDTSELAHEHELLETLYHDVWSNRFINPTPSCESSPTVTARPPTNIIRLVP